MLRRQPSSPRYAERRVRTWAPARSIPLCDAGRQGCARGGTRSAACIYQVLAAHPELEIVQRPAPDEKRPSSSANFHAGPPTVGRSRSGGVGTGSLGDPAGGLGYARDTLNSYFVFQTMKEKRVLPAICASSFPCRWSTACCRRTSSPNQGDLAKMRPLQSRIRAEFRHHRRANSGQGTRDPMELLDGGQHDAYGGVPGYPLEGCDRAQFG